VGNDHLVGGNRLAALPVGRPGPSAVLRLGVDCDGASVVDHGDESVMSDDLSPLAKVERQGESRTSPLPIYRLPGQGGFAFAKASLIMWFSYSDDYLKGDPAYREASQGISRRDRIPTGVRPRRLFCFCSRFNRLKSSEPKRP
jgi:hypothetical protein